MWYRRLAPLLIPLLLAACAGDRSDDGTTFHLAMPHIGLPRLATPQFLKDKPGVYRGELQKTAYSGRPAQLWGDVSLSRDCTIAGETKLEVISQPAHGTAVIIPGQMYAVYPDGDPHAACSGRLVNGVLALYTADAGYVGADQAVLRGTTADGDLRLVTVDIAVSLPPAHTGVRRPLLGPRPPAAAPLVETPVTPTYRPRPIDPGAPAPTVVQSPYPSG
jgi:hypothetical protein